MAKPLSIVRAAQAADAAILAQQGYAPDTPTNDPSQMDAEFDTREAGVEAPPQNLFAVSDTDPTPAADDDAAPSQEESQDYEHRFRVLQGKYKAETGRMRDELSATNNRLAQTQDLLATVAARPAAAPAVAPDPEPVAPSLSVAPLHARELEEFGEDMLDASSRFTLSKLMPVIDGLRAEVSSLRSQVGKASAAASSAASTVAVSARERMFALLDEGTPDWRSVNTTDDFKNWLAQEDGMSGETRHTLLLRAYERNEGLRVKRFFDAYTAESNAGDEPATRKSARTDPARAPVSVSPSALVAPGRGRAAPVAIAPPKAEWTPYLIAAFYTDVRNGVFRNREAERANLEADIFDAQREGRVVAN